ncbi:MAG: hypothetical protein JNL47_04070 [Bacteroidia bacterium]|nr:hypothetical protein [Bacteroidia bacterium]
MDNESNRLPDEKSEFSEHAEHSEMKSGEQGGKRRIKIKKRIKQRVRVKKKPSIKKRIRKILGYLAWLIVIGGFLVTVVILVKELDIKDENAKKQAPKKKQVYRLPNKMMHALLTTVRENKKVIHFNKTENITALNSLA